MPKYVGGDLDSTCNPVTCTIQFILSYKEQFTRVFKSPLCNAIHIGGDPDSKSNQEPLPFRLRWRWPAGPLVHPPPTGAFIYPPSRFRHACPPAALASPRRPTPVSARRPTPSGAPRPAHSGFATPAHSGVPLRRTPVSPRRPTMDRHAGHTPTKPPHQTSIYSYGIVMYLPYHPHQCVHELVPNLINASTN
jgi:hypothetical protein